MKGFLLIIESFGIRNCKMFFFLRYSYIQLSARLLSVHCSTCYFKRRNGR